MKNIPKKIYLQIGEVEKDDDFKELEVTWCSQRIHKNDIVYVRPPKRKKP